MGMESKGENLVFERVTQVDLQCVDGGVVQYSRKLIVTGSPYFTGRRLAGEMPQAGLVPGHAYIR